MDPIKENPLSEPIRLGNATLGANRHVCAFFHSADEEYRVLLPFIQEGLQRGLAKIGGKIVIDVMRTHPLVILGGVLQENPFFVPPEEFLRELRDRKANRKATPA